MPSLRTTSPSLPRYSCRMYLQLVPEDISVLKFLLEAEENLAYLSTVSPQNAVVKLVFAPGQEQAVREFLETVQGQLTLHAVLTCREADMEAMTGSGGNQFREGGKD